MSDPATPGTGVPLESLGRYRIRGVLGKGAMGLVYDGLDPNLDRRVAIKTILTRKLDADSARMVAVRFEREVHAVARLNHPNIVQVYDFGTEGDLAYIVMEFIQGRELQDYFDKGERFDLRAVFGLMTELLDALDFAHEAGIIHRDVKPANVMVDAGGHAKLTDFGVARMTDGPQGEATRVGAQVGTPSYMSPEQIQGLTLDRRTDVFSAGIIFYQFLTGRKPFEAPSQFGLQAKIVQEDPVWPSRLVQVPQEFDRVVARALAKEPDQRYGTARKFADALRRILEGKAPEEPGEAPLLAPASAAADDASGSEADVEFWNEVKDSREPEDLELYLEQFKRGKFADEARRKLAALKAGG
ncbi:MAG: serine/threonine-protein kinase [Pseudomonadota bacterium]